MSQHEDHGKTVRDALSKNVVIDIGARIGYLVSRFFIPPFVLAHVSLEAYGLWATAFIIVSYLGISTLGISNVYVKFVAEYAARKEYDRANALLSTGLCLTLPLSILCFAGLWLVWPRLAVVLQIAPAMREDAQVVVLSVVAIFLSSIALSVFRDVLTGVQRIAANQIVWVVAYTIETVLIFALVGMGRGIRGLAEAFLIRTGIEIALSALIAFRTLPWLRLSPGRWDRACGKLLFSFGGIVQIQSMLAIGLNSVERAVAVPLIGLEAAGLLDIGKKLPSMAASIPSAFASSLVPAASYLYGGLDGSSEAREALRKLYLKGARYMNLAAAYLCGFLASFSLPLLDTWLGKRYEGAAILAAVFAIATQVHLMTGPGTSILKGVGRPREEFYYCLPNLASLLVTLPLARFLGGGWSPVNIGVAVAVATLLSAVYFLRHANRLLGVSVGEYWRRVAWPGILPYVAGGVLAWPASMIFPQANRWMGLVWIGVFGVLYTGLVALIVHRWLFEHGERLWFHAIARTRLVRLGLARA